MTFSYRIVPIKKYGRNKGHQYNPIVVTAAGKMHQQMPNLVGESLRKNRLYSLKISPPKYLVISKGKIVTTQRRILLDTTLAEGEE